MCCQSEHERRLLKARLRTTSGFLCSLVRFPRIDAPIMGVAPASLYLGCMAPLWLGESLCCPGLQKQCLCVQLHLLGLQAEEVLGTWTRWNKETASSLKLSPELYQLWCLYPQDSRIALLARTSCDTAHCGSQVTTEPLG